MLTVDGWAYARWVAAFDRVPELEEIYDEQTVAALDRASGQPDIEPWRPEARRLRFGGALLTGSALALQEVFDPTPERDAVVEFRPDTPDPESEWVTFVYVHRAPHLSRLIVRPWLARSA